MSKFSRRGAFFVVVALICFAAGVLSQNRGVFFGVGAFWLVMATVVSAKDAKRL
jgi:hypothetical protein